MPQQTGHRMFLLFTILFGIITFVHGQVNSDLDRPFITKDGVDYRDKLTIASSKSVANFAKSYQRRQNGQALRDRRLSKSSRGRLQTATFTTFGVGYDPNSHAAAFDKRFPVIDFKASRRLRYLAKHKKERTKADDDEARMVNEEKQSVAPRRQTNTRFNNRRPTPQNPRARFSNPQRLRTQQSVPARPRARPSTPGGLRTQPSFPKRPRAQVRRPRPVNRFIARTTPRPTPRSQIRQFFNTQHPTNVGINAQIQQPFVASGVILPAAEYFKSVTNYQPSPNYQYQLGTIQPQPITSVPATTHHEYSGVDQYGHFFGSIPVNYGFSINHV